MINFAIRNDKKALLKFAALQSATGKQLQEKFQIDKNAESLILLDNGVAYTHSDAALRIAKYLRWPVKMLYIFILIPHFIRQPIYKWIARNRYKWFGQRESCMIPGPDIRARFLD